MATDELAAWRWFRKRLDELGEQHPELQTLEARKRLTAELARQAREGEDMTENSVRPKGRPKGSTTATVELETVSFKAPVEFMARVRAYAKQHRQSISELVRDGLEERLNGSDPLDYRYGLDPREEPPSESAGESGALYTLITALTAEVQQMRVAMQALEQRVAGQGRVKETRGITDNTGNTDNANKSNMSNTENHDIPSYPPFDLSKFYLGKLCPKRHDYYGTGQSLLRRHNQSCRECERLSKQAKRQAKAQQEAAASA
jgi:hypothetical protein